MTSTALQAAQKQQGSPAYLSMQTIQASAPATLLSANQLTKSYGSFQALKGISFDMREGEIISVLGPSGCGKSTLLQLVAGLSKPDSGQLLLSGEVIASTSVMMQPEKRGVNMVFQDYALWPHMNVYDNIAYGLNRSKMAKADIMQRVQELLAMLRLEGLERRLPPQLSGGQQQRVSIARAIATRPRLMLLDEPLSNLDMRLRVEMRTEMAYLFRSLGMSVFHVTHDPEEAFAMADRLLILRDGQIDQIGTPQECFSRPASRWAASLLGAINGLRGAIVNDQYGCAVRIGSSLIYGLQAAAMPRLGDDDNSVVMFRPEDALILSRSSTTAQSNDNSPPDAAEQARNTLTLKVSHCTFEGNRWRTVAQTDCGQKLYLVHETPLESGEQVSVRLSHQSAFIYPNEEER
ncbi:ABC transporter ATP-binding protein [Paenibacillus sinopodophylli]|uniref:ABC transporter ATP-binding protein n=1 Tax=Paenibacillus sinopodophylli TaxID=1837342 RepID=UPI001FE2A6E2|nr:ABC transporter ATP-binding protein [Paenibacillus sinopodophylli]